jgi:hypothetical protein
MAAYELCMLLVTSFDLENPNIRKSLTATAAVDDCQSTGCKDERDQRSSMRLPKYKEIMTPSVT